MSVSRRPSLLAQVKRISSLPRLPRAIEHCPFLSQLYYHQQANMGSASPTASFVPLVETSLFKPLKLGKWHLQHRIVQVSISEHVRGLFSPVSLAYTIFPGATHTHEE